MIEARIGDAWKLRMGCEGSAGACLSIMVEVVSFGRMCRC